MTDPEMTDALMAALESGGEEDTLRELARVLKRKGYTPPDPVRWYFAEKTAPEGFALSKEAVDHLSWQIRDLYRALSGNRSRSADAVVRHRRSLAPIA